MLLCRKRRPGAERDISPQPREHACACSARGEVPTPQPRHVVEPLGDSAGDEADALPRGAFHLSCGAFSAVQQRWPGEIQACKLREELAPAAQDVQKLGGLEGRAHSRPFRHMAIRMAPPESAADFVYACDGAVRGKRVDEMGDQIRILAAPRRADMARCVEPPLSYCLGGRGSRFALMARFFRFVLVCLLRFYQCPV